MKLRLIAAGCLLATLSLTSCADEKPHRPEGPGPGPGAGAGGMGNPQQNAEKMAGELGLSGEQKMKFMAAMKEHGQKMKALRGQGSMSQEERTRQVSAARQQLQQRMHGILTQEQFAKWRQERQAMHPAGSKGGSE